MSSTVPEAKPPRPFASSHSASCGNASAIDLAPRAGHGLRAILRALLRTFADRVLRPMRPVRRLLLDTSNRQRRPARLVAGADAAAGVAVEVLVEQHEIAPVRIRRVARVVPVAGPPALRVGQEQRRQPARDLVRRLAQVELAARPGRDLDLEVVAVEVVEALERLD